MILRPFNPNDARTILSWCKDKHAFRLWSADRYKEFPAQPEEMMEQYTGDNMYPLTAVVGEEIVGHILLRFPSEDKSVIRFGFVIVDDSKRGKGYGKQSVGFRITGADAYQIDGEVWKGFEMELELEENEYTDHKRKP